MGASLLVLSAVVVQFCELLVDVCLEGGQSHQLIVCGIRSAALPLRVEDSLGSRYVQSGSHVILGALGVDLDIDVSAAVVHADEGPGLIGSMVYMVPLPLDKTGCCYRSYFF